MTTVRSGGCLCGAVRYEARWPPLMVATCGAKLGLVVQMFAPKPWTDAAGAMLCQDCTRALKIMILFHSISLSRASITNWASECPFCSLR